MNNQITLSAAEILLAGTVGLMWGVQNIHNGTHNAHTYGADRDESRWQTSIEGACGEAAFAKWWGVFWSGNVGNPKADDVAGMQVRTTHHQKGCLVLHNRDADDKMHFLVVGAAPHYRIAGWLWGHEGKQPEYWKDPTGKGRHAYFVPQHRLRPITELPPTP